MRFPLFGSRVSGFWPGVVCALLVYGAFSLGLTEHLEGTTLDGLFRARGPRDADPRVVIIAIDDATVVRAGERTGTGWPLPRSYYARAIRDLHRLGAKTIALDVLFSEPSPNASHDRELASQSRLAGSIVHACAFQVPAKRVEISPFLEASALPQRFTLPVGADAGLIDVRRAVWATGPLPDLLSGAKAVGHVNVFPEASGTLRRVPHLLSWHGKMFPSLSLASATQFLGAEPVFDGGRQQINLAGRQIPVDNHGSTLVNWIGAGEAYPKWGLNQLLDGEIPEAAIRDRAVVIGVTALGAFENRATPFAGNIAAVDFQANALDDILSDRVLKPVVPPVSLALLLGFPVVCALVTARRGGSNLWPVPVLIGLLLLSGWLCLHRDIYLPIGTPALGGALAFAVTAALGYRREWESGTRFDAAASSLARGTTLMSAALGSGARDEAQLLQIIRDTARETLGAREVFLVRSEADCDERARLAAQMAQETGRPWFFPTDESAQPSMEKHILASSSGAPNASNLSAKSQLLRGQNLIAAPLLNPSNDSFEENTDSKKFCGALVAIGSRDGIPFTQRDATMLETLAKGAALALENLRYSNALRSRIEGANHELETAYRLLAEQSAKLFAAVEAIDAALIVCNARGEVAFVNGAAHEILRDATPMLGQCMVEALQGGELDQIAALFVPLFENEGNQDSNLAPTHLEIARERQLLTAQFMPLWSNENGFLGTMLVVSDITAQRELERMKSDFVGFVAHELRTPLSTILGYTSLLETMAGRFSADETRTMTETISRHCRRMNAMISDLLDISRLDSGEPLPLRLDLFDLDVVCERLVLEQRTYLNPTPPREILFQCNPRPLTFWGDSDRIEQVVLNLLSNAVKYSPDGGKITLSLLKTASALELSVSDEGMGLSQEQIGKMFQKFYRTEESKARGIKGNGLGLNLVKQIVEAHGGSINVFSKRDQGGKGTTFRVILPVEPKIE